MNKQKIIINNQETEYLCYETKKVSILEECMKLGIRLPRFCYHEYLSVVGNCRICLIEIENVDKPIPSCITEVQDGISIYTHSNMALKSRENISEALLLNHPLDCPICDQGGECDLQDLSMKNGGSQSRFMYKKKAVQDKYCGPLINLIMTRCISCTRCARYSTEIAGVNFFGTLGRGKETEIDSYIPNFFNSEMSLGVVDLCPVASFEDGDK